MLSKETLDEYRRMTPGERLQLTFELCRKYEHCLYIGTPYQIARRLERMRKSKDEANQRILDALARAEQYEKNQGDSSSP